MSESYAAPHLAWSTLENIAEEIPSGVSAAEVGQIISSLGPCPKEINDKIKATIVEELKGRLKMFWEQENVDQKLQDAANLDNCDLDVRALRSKQDLFSVIAAKHLQSFKKILLAKIKEIEEENLSTEECLKTKAALLKEQIKLVKSQNFSL